MLKKHWKIQDDRLLTKLIETHGTKNWIKIKEEINKSKILRFIADERSCKRRWKYIRVKDMHYDYKLSKEKKLELIEKQEIYGSKWSKIKEFFPKM